MARLEVITMIETFLDRPVHKQRLFSMHYLVIAILFLSCLVSCAPVTQQKKVQEFSEDLLSVTFPTEKEGWACGRWGTVLRTGDGGRTWTPQASGTDNTLCSIYFVDSRNGWAVGEEETIIHTTDGGKAWEKQKSPVPFSLMKVHFVTPQKGWIVGERTHVLFTVDGGKTWNVQFKDEDFILKSISFCDALNGWAVGEYGFIYHTKDGGVTWKNEAGFFDISEKTGEVVAGTFLFDVVAVNPETAWAVGIDGYVTRTIDGGRTWKEVKTGAPKTQLFCISSNLAGTLLMGGNSTFLISTDNGKTWENPACEPPITYGWLYGLAPRGSAGFVAVGWEGSIYLNDGKNPLASWQRARI